jgi:hypothetical protein
MQYLPQSALSLPTIPSRWDPTEKPLGPGQGQSQ